MPKAPNNPKVIYHFTSQAGLSEILRSGHISLTESNLNIRKGNCGVVWLTSSPDAENHGLKFDDAILSELDKTTIRISLPYKPSYKRWDEWSDVKGMDKSYKETLIASAHAEEIYKTWYVSECEIPAAEFIKVENLATSETIPVAEAMNALPETKTPKPLFRNETDEYIFNQLAELQILLLNVRQLIRETLPDATEKISWQMPTYWRGRNIIHFAAQKNHLGIYPGAAAMEHFAPRLTGYKTSKGAVQFPYKSFGAEQMKLIAEIAAWCGQENRLNG